MVVGSAGHRLGTPLTPFVSTHSSTLPFQHSLGRHEQDEQGRLPGRCASEAPTGSLARRPRLCRASLLHSSAADPCPLASCCRRRRRMLTSRLRRCFLQAPLSAAASVRLMPSAFVSEATGGLDVRDYGTDAVGGAGGGQPSNLAGGEMDGE